MGRVLYRAMRPMLDPERDLKGATPEKLARALFRRTEPLRPRPGVEPVARDEIAVEEAASDHAGDGVRHLGESA